MKKDLRNLKPIVRIENAFLFGSGMIGIIISGHPYIGDGRPVYTSDIVRISPGKKVVETLSSIYKIKNGLKL